MTMDTSIAEISCDRCRIRLKLPNYFAEASLNNIRKMFKLIYIYSYENEEAIEKLGCFFTEWPRLCLRKKSDMNHRTKVINAYESIIKNKLGG